MKIETSSLGICSVAKGGDRISLGLIETSGNDIEIDISVEDACAIAMTLPRLLKNALREKYRDPSLRHVFPLESWKVEGASDGAQLVLTLATGKGFEVSFSAKGTACRSLGSALSKSEDQLAESPTILQN